MFSFSEDISDMHTKFGVNEWMKQQLQEGNYDKIREFLKFRMDFIQEEFDETKNAIDTRDPEEVVDGLIDIIVVALGTLDAFGVNHYKAWKEVHRANISKNVGIKESRPNPLGLPDLIKPEGWEAPSHKDNVGFFKEIL